MNTIKEKIKKSFALQEHAKIRIPGMTQLLSKRPDRFSYGVWPGYFSKAKGVEVWDLDGNKYIDMSIGGIGANILGYADPDVDNAVIEAISKGTSCSLNCPEEVELADLLCEIHPWADKVRFARCGGEAVAIAVRIARAFTQRDIVAFCGYHGWHDWYLAANLGGQDFLKKHLQEGLAPIGVPKGLLGTAIPFYYNDLNGLLKIINDKGDRIAAIVMEPIRNVQPDEGFLDGVKEIAHKNGSVLVIDEISSGFRLNTGGAHLLYNLIPDLAVYSKALGNGYPMAAIIGKGNVMEAVQRTFISSTYWTERIGPIAALAMIKKHRKNKVADHLQEIGTKVQKGWRNIADKHAISIDIKGISPLSHFSFQSDNALSLKALMIQEMLGYGFLASNSFYAMYAHTDDHVLKYLQALDSTFNTIRQAIESNQVESSLAGKASVAGFSRLN